MAAGQPEYQVKRTTDPPFAYARHVDAIARSYPEIRIVPADGEWYRAGKADAQALRKDIEVMGQESLRRSQYYKDLALETKGNDVKYVDLLEDATLHQSLHAYSKWIGTEKFRQI